MRGLWIAAVCALLPACIRDDLVSCPDDGLLCAVGDVCDAVHHICITPEQAAVCSGMPDATPCSAGPLNGACNMGVCLPTGCGNHVVDQGEVCDDGNRISGDGCNAICTSTEACGNSILDPSLGETCDDGNLISHDGCDSRCGTEQIAWTVEGIAPSIGAPGWAAYDPLRHRVVHVGRTGTWELDGLDWKLVTLEAPHALSYHAVTWAPSISRLVYITSGGGSTMTYTWDGTTWTQLATTAVPALVALAVTYYPPTQSVMAVGLTGAGLQLWSLDPGNGTWTQITSMPTFYFSYGGGIAYDSTRNTLVVVGAGDGGPNSAHTYEWDGTTWTGAATSFGTASGLRQWGLLYDPVSGGVVAVGGLLGATPTKDVYKYTGASTWPIDGSLPAPRYDTEVAFDTDLQRMIVINGTTSAGVGDAIMIRTGTTWAAPARHAPPFSIGAALTYDSARHRIVRYGGTFAGNSAWTYDGTWHDVTDSSTPSLTDAAIAYDPVRDASVISSASSGTWLLEADTWRKLATIGATPEATAMTFDPERRALVAVTSVGIAWALPSDADTWSVIAPTAVFSSSDLTLAYDARGKTLVVADQTSGRAYDIGPTDWIPTLSPGASHVVIENRRRGTIEFIALDGTMSWERVAGVWFSQQPPPLSLALVSVVDDASTGDLMLAGNVDDARILLRRTFSSSVPAETCIASEDTDGDMLAGCADADCWFTCTPACPPYASCP